MSPQCKTYFQCPCCKEVFEIEVSATANIRSFVDKNGEIFDITRLESVVLEKPQRIPSRREKAETPQEGKKK